MGRLIEPLKDGDLGHVVGGKRAQVQKHSGAKGEEKHAMSTVLYHPTKSCSLHLADPHQPTN